MRVEKRLIRFGVRSFTLLMLLIVMASGPRLNPTVIAKHNKTVSLTRQDQQGFRLSSDKSYVKVPFDLYWDGILLQARINNSQPVWLALDTGANINIINQSVFDRLALSPKGDANLTGGGGIAKGQFADNVTISLPGVEAYKQPIASAPLDAMSLEGRDVEGLIGTPFLMNFVVEIDYEHKVLTFHDPKVFNLAKEPDAIPMEGRNGWPYVEAELSINGQDKITDKFMLDTGSNRIFHVNRPFAEAHKILEMLPGGSTAEGVGEGIGGRVKFTEARIHSIRIGKYTMSRPVVSISQDTEGFGAGPAAGVVGGEMLRRFTLVLDYSTSRMLLRPNAYFSEPYEVDMSGLELVTKPDDFKAIMIKSVLANYPAAKAGLREGDEIVSIDGRPASEYNLDILTKMFKRDGKVYLLTVRRGSRLMKVRMKTKRAV
ncbi:MAG TPA: aspartyl protease family protein [Pyrinomonadaceae bacterium]|nr:aspartyl protease family protein [Pyrinomonadaceae bacterium]